MASAMNIYTTKVLIFLLIIMINPFVTYAKDNVIVKTVHPPKCSLIKETNSLLCPRILEINVTVYGKDKHLVRCTLFSEEEEILAFGEGFINKPGGKLFLTLRTRSRIHGMTLIAGAKCSSDQY